MLLDELAQKTRMPGYDLACRFEVGAPTYKVSVKACMQRPTEIPILAEFVLRLIAAGLKSENAIATALGLEADYVRIALSFLSNHQYILGHIGTESSIAFYITSKGHDVLESVLVSMFYDHFDFLVDGVTGAFSGRRAAYLQTAHELQKVGVRSFLQVEECFRPSVDMLNANHSRLVHVYKEWRESSGGSSVDLIEIDEIEDRYLGFRVLSILVFRCRETERLVVRVFEGYEERPDYGELLTHRERETGGVVPANLMCEAEHVVQSDVLLFSDLDPSEVTEIGDEIALVMNEQAEVTVTEPEADKPITAKSQRIMELEDRIQVLESSSSRPIYDFEHRKLLEDSFKNAQHSMLIISPWVRREATNAELLKLIKSAIDRGVNVAIGYGMPVRPGDTETYMDEDVEEELKRIQGKSGKGILHYEQLKGTHEKIVVCDDEYCVVTSFNWLSYRGNKGFRKETGILSRNPDTVQEIKEQVLRSFRSIPSVFV